MSAQLILPAPAKVNYFLHVTGRRDDGYHTLETLFVLIDLADTVSLTVRPDGMIERGADVAGVPAADDLTLRAAHALQRAATRRARAQRGVTIALTKRIP
ncbi:MAG: 4-(cytidine 5'-diphospho)-2-C-methyl-D-erythritol kinase, partial [Casimicrobiaceae bacterium]